VRTGRQNIPVFGLSARLLSLLIVVVYPIALNQIPHKVTIPPPAKSIRGAEVRELEAQKRGRLRRRLWPRIRAKFDRAGNYTGRAICMFPLYIIYTNVAKTVSTISHQATNLILHTEKMGFSPRKCFRNWNYSFSRKSLKINFEISEYYKMIYGNNFL